MSCKYLCRLFFPLLMIIVQNKRQGHHSYIEGKNGLNNCTVQVLYNVLFLTCHSARVLNGLSHHVRSCCKRLSSQRTRMPLRRRDSWEFWFILVTTILTSIKINALIGYLDRNHPTYLPDFMRTPTPVCSGNRLTGLQDGVLENIKSLYDHLSVRSVTTGPSRISFPTAGPADITAVVLNWKRPANVAFIVDSLCASELSGTIAEVVVWNNSPEALLLDRVRLSSAHLLL